MHSHIHEISDSITPIIEVRHESVVALTEYARIAIAFEVNEVFDVATSLESQFTLTPRQLPVPYVKDYDSIDSPADWSQRFDISKWAFFSAFAEGQRLGGATVAYDTAGLDMLEGRTDVAVLWDIRVAAFTRRRGLGTALFSAAAAWASGNGCRELKVETQNINVAACRFYARQGCVLRAARKGAYPGLPDEVQLVWYKNLGRAIAR